MFTKMRNRVAVLGLLGAASLLAQDAPLSNSAVKIDLPNDAPVSLQGFTTGPSRTTARGAALVLDLQLLLTLKNTSANRIHGVRLRVVSQEVAVGGAATVFQPSLNVGPGEAFPVHIDAQLWHPAQLAGGPLVQVYLDGVLFQDLSFYGPDKLQSRRIMTANEMEAQRDREYSKRLCAQQGLPALKAAMVRILARQDAAPQLQGRVSHGRTVTNAGMAAAAPERQAAFAFLRFPDSPVDPVLGSAMVAGGEVRAPSIVVRSRTNQPVKHVELGWVLTDAAGRDYLAGLLPSSDTGFSLPASGSATVSQDSTLSFSAGNQAVSIQKITGFVNQVEFADGKVWVPTRKDLENPLLVKVLAPSVEEERLANLYLRKGPQAVAEELKKF